MMHIFTVATSALSYSSGFNWPALERLKRFYAQSLSTKLASLAAKSWGSRSARPCRLPARASMPTTAQLSFRVPRTTSARS